MAKATKTRRAATGTKTIGSTKTNRDVALLAYDHITLFEFAMAIDIFGFVRPEVSEWYNLQICSLDTGPLTALGGVRLEAKRSLAILDRADTIIIPGWRDVDETPPARLLSKLQKAHARGARILSVCTGAFVLAAAGLLDGRRATTHWRHAGLLAERYPAIDVNPNVLYVDEGSLLTSAGSAAGIDLCLYLIRRDWGVDVAKHVARALVVPPHREGGQAQYIDTPIDAESENGLTRLHDYLRANLGKPHTIESMSRRSHLTPRTLARRFEELTQMSPYRWLTKERIRRAQELLETTDLDIETLAVECGMGSAQQLRLHFRRQTGTTPTAYRNAFQ